MINYSVIIPAAGIGSRMNSERPKQYLKINGKAIIEYSLSVFLADPRCQKIVVALHPDDKYWSGLVISKAEKIQTVQGGDYRYQSVLNGLLALQTVVGEDDWVLVHDAARPLLLKADVDTLLNTLQDARVGGLLAAPLHATIKRVDGQKVVATEPREQLWQALTPQMFRYGVLREAYSNYGEENITDSSSAIEQLGLTPTIVPGYGSNIKVTTPEDLLFLRSQLCE